MLTMQKQTLVQRNNQDITKPYHHTCMNASLYTIEWSFLSNSALLDLHCSKYCDTMDTFQMSYPMLVRKG